MTQPTIAQLHNLINRAGHGLTPDEQARLRDGIDQLETLQAVARGYCPNCGRGDAAPTVADWDTERRRAEAAEATTIRVQAAIASVDSRGVLTPGEVIAAVRAALNPAQEPTP